jgi:hypothetical protein
MRSRGDTNSRLSLPVRDETPHVEGQTMDFRRVVMTSGRKTMLSLTDISALSGLWQIAPHRYPLVAGLSTSCDAALCSLFYLIFLCTQLRLTTVLLSSLPLLSFFAHLSPKNTRTIPHSRATFTPLSSRTCLEAIARTRIIAPVVASRPSTKLS